VPHWLPNDDLVEWLIRFNDKKRESRLRRGLHRRLLIIIVVIVVALIVIALVVTTGWQKKDAETAAGLIEPDAIKSAHPIS
jgi:hypothetical protein